MPRCPTHLRSLILAAMAPGVAVCSAPAHAQPASFLDVGAIAPAASPHSVREYVEFPPGLFDFGVPGSPGEILTVKWIRFSVPQGVPSPLYLDLDTRIVNIEGPPGDLVVALYDAKGNLIALDDSDGSFPPTFAAGLSFGSDAIRLPPVTPTLQGQDGELGAGEYWFALVAGPASSVTANPTNWDISTTGSYQLGFFDPGTYYMSVDFAAGNTTPIDPPINDGCNNAILIGENSPSDEPAWVGTNAGATLDGFSPCYELTPPFEPKDIWFTYIPSATGFAEVLASGGAEGAATPILTRYGPSCGDPPQACVGGGSFVFDEAARLFFPVVVGEPVVLALAIRAGDFGPLALNIRLLEPACELTIPAGAAHESELACGQDSNGGCNSIPPVYDPIIPGVPVTGTLFNTTAFRDLDWFEFMLTADGPVTVTFAAQYPSVATVIGEPDPGACLAFVELFVENPDLRATCQQFSQTADLAAGVYRVALAHRFFDGQDCLSGYERYWLRIDAPNEVPACRADFNRDGIVNSTDVGELINSWFEDQVNGTLTADWDHNGIVNSTDVGEFINSWFEDTSLGCG